ncbi:hypothetical protein K438DRAFT_1934090 [Mycena galopus ATCC 62051]|nr:hypothetical protein K438DRAFT_1934090 [Mycena galopus ATCC 62051]
MDAIADPLPTRFIRLPDDGGCTYRLLDFFGDKPKHKGFRLVKLSGSTTHPIVDSNGKVCALYGGMPNNEGFMADVHDAASHALEEARAMASLSYEQLHHHLKNFAQILGGDSHSGGQPYHGALVTPTYPLLWGNAGTHPVHGKGVSSDGLSTSFGWRRNSLQHLQMRRMPEREKHSPVPLVPSRTPPARQLAQAKYCENHKEEEAEKSRIRMAQYRASIKADPEHVQEQKDRQKCADKAYREKNWNLLAFKKWEKRKKADAQKGTKQGYQTEEKRDYALEYALWTHRKQEELQKKVSDALLQNSWHT